MADPAIKAANAEARADAPAFRFVANFLAGKSAVVLNVMPDGGGWSIQLKLSTPDEPAAPADAPA